MSRIHAFFFTYHGSRDLTPLHIVPMRLRVFSAYCGSRTNYNASSERLEMLSLDEWMNLLDELDFFDEDFNRREVRQENEREGRGGC